MIRWARLAEGTGHDAARALSHRLLESALPGENGAFPELKPLSHTPEGRPFLPGRPGVHISLTHCEGLAACAVAVTPVGIDAERLRTHSPYAARHAMGNAELDAIRNARDPDIEFFRRWTLKESCLKAMGTGLGYPLKELGFFISGGKAVCISRPEYGFWVYDLDGFVLALCVKRH